MTLPRVTWDLSPWNDAPATLRHLDATAYRLAAEWFTDPSRPLPLSALIAECPGFTARCYDEAISRNLVWARR